MKAFSVREQKSKAVLVEVDLPRPTPQPGEILVAVRAAGVTPSELHWYPTTHCEDGSPRRDAVPGHEFSGVVTAVGAGASTFKVGDAVFGISNWYKEGATAQFCLSAEGGLIRKPESLSHTTAAVIPISGVTAWQGLVDHAKIKANDRVLVVGASGSVGLMAVQVAAMHGCAVFGSASASSESTLKALGCQQVLDYKSQPFQDHLEKIDVVFDTVGGDTLACAEKILAPNARMVTIAADAERSDDPLIKKAYFTMDPSSDQLQHVVELIGQGRLYPFLKAVLPFAEAAKVYAGQVYFPSLGKVALEIDG